MPKKLRRITLDISVDGEQFTDAQVKTVLVNSLNRAANYADLWNETVAFRILMKLKAAALASKVELV